MLAGSVPPRHAVVVEFYVETSKCDWTHACCHHVSQAAMEGPSYFSLCKMQLFKQHFKSLLRCEASITDTEVSGWLLNSLKLLFSAMQMILFRTARADTDDDRDASRMNICYPNSQHGQKRDTVWVLIGWIPPVLWKWTCDKILVWKMCVVELDMNICCSCGIQQDI